MSEQVQGIKRAKTWQIALFSLNNSATNAFAMFMVYIAYFANGVGGIAFITASYVITNMRIFDAFTDPVIGFLIDKLNFGKLGKFRPWMVIGNVIMAISIATLIFGMSTVPEGMEFAFYIGCYFVYIIGFTCQTACTKAAQSCLTKDPKQRPLMSLFDAIFSILVLGSYGVYVSVYLIGKHGDYTEALFKEFVVVAIILGLIFTILAVIGLGSSDVAIETEEKEKHKTKFVDYVEILKHNDALRKLMSAAAIDKLANLTANNPITLIIIFALVINNYGLSGSLTFMGLIPMIIVIAIGTKFNQKFGMRSVMIKFKMISLGICTLLTAMLLFTDISATADGGFTPILTIFIAIYIIEQAIRTFTGSTFTPMIADCIDYEESITGRENPGMIGTMYSLIEKFVSSLSATVAGIAVALVGFGEVAPTVTTELTTGLFYAGAVLILGLPMLSSVFTIIQLKRYPLTKERMEEIQLQISKEK